MGLKLHRLDYMTKVWFGKSTIYVTEFAITLKHKDVIRRLVLIQVQ